MARLLFMVLVSIHGLIHLMGFAQAFGFADIEELTQPVSRPLGVIWLLTSLLFIPVVIQYALKHAFWWITAILAVAVSQALVIVFWQDAWFGTIPNVVILAVAIIGAAGFNFQRSVSQEVEEMFSSSTDADRSTVTEDLLVDLPAPVQRWLANSGIVGRERIRAVRLKQDLLMKMKPEAEMWTPAHAEQYFTIDEPAFIWKVKMHMMPLLSVSGRDKFAEGRGEMLIKVLSLVPVVNSKNNERINAGTLQRYLGEMVWFPSAALRPYIAWEEVDARSARATMSYKGTTGSGVFHFDEHGNVVRYTARRYMGDAEGAERRDWIIAVQETKVMNGVKMPTRMEATWKLDEGNWTWLKLALTDIEFNTLDQY